MNNVGLCGPRCDGPVVTTLYIHFFYRSYVPICICSVNRLPSSLEGLLSVDVCMFSQNRDYTVCHLTAYYSCIIPTRSGVCRSVICSTGIITTLEVSDSSTS